MSWFWPQRVRLRDGSEALLRCFQPEVDRAAWSEMILSCSQETLWRRFELRSAELIIFRPQDFCRCQAGTDLILVAEREGKLMGEVRLCLFSGGKEAELCVLVADPWQGLGLGGLLTDAALQAARRLGVKRVVVEVVPENLQIIRLLQSRGFVFHSHSDGRVFRGEKWL